MLLRDPSAIALRVICTLALLLLGGTSFAGDRGEGFGLEALEGQWYLLVHYRDVGEGDPGEEVFDAPQWIDRVWRFARDRGRLRWTIVPGLDFDDPTGRFVTLEDDRMARSLGAWTPNASQRKEIARGLRTDAEGERTKSLRARGPGVFASGGAPVAQSASVIGLSERWVVRGLDGLPVFERVDEMGSGRSDALVGRTRYATEEVLHEGNELRGRFERDESLRGRFRLIRMGVPAPVGAAGHR